MDKHYNKVTAGEQLQRIIKERLEQGPTNAQLQLYQTTGGASTDAIPVFVDRPRSWKLTKTIDEDGNSEEIVLRIQGIISKRELPPIRRPQRIEPHKRRYLRQAVTLTAFGASSFQDSIESILDISHTFSRSLPSDSMENWVPTVSDGHPAVEAGNRYFVDRHDQTDDETVPFKQCVDPDGILEKAMGSDFCHTMENEVEYFEISHTNNMIGYNKINPNKIRVGDIVEAQISFVAAPVKDRRYKLLIVLRAITLLDCQPLKDADRARAQHTLQNINIKNVQRPKKLKRNVGYVEDVEEATRAKVARMSIDK